MSTPRLIWDCGTGYDLFVSLHVLHNPSRYGLRGTWARGVRARLAPADREILEQSSDFVWPHGWVHTLPDPKDGATVLSALARLPAAERLATLTSFPKADLEAKRILEAVKARGAWDEEDQRALSALAKHASEVPKKKTVERVLDWWSRSEEFGERYLAALRAYFEAFYAKEEVRILDHLEDAVARGRALAERLTLFELLGELSQGLRLSQLPDVPELVLAPSFWSTPLLVFARVNPERELILFGARPSDASLVPGEVVPDALMRALKALGDPTRLRILRYLTAEPLSPTQIAGRLRLRAPTVLHHLDKLRMAGLVHVTLEKGDKRRYAARAQAVQSALAMLETFLHEGATAHERE